MKSMKKSIYYLRAILLLMVAVLVQNSYAQINVASKIPIDTSVKIGKLPNGLTYYIKKNVKPEKKVELRLVVNAGSILEEENQLGLAHFMEHMNFNGSKHFPKNDLVNYLQTIGVKFGADLNAYTSFDETVYILPIPAEKQEIIEKGFTVLEDWAGGALLTDEEINKERGVVLEELRSGKGSQERMRNQYFPKLLNGSKYANRIPIGKEELLKSFKPDVLRKFYHDWYRPDLMAVIVVGDIDPKEAEAKIKAHFSALKNPTPAKPRPAIIPIAARQKEEAFSVSDKEGEQTQIEIINYIKPSKDQILWGDYKFNLVRDLFGEMFNQRLEELTQKANPPFLFAYTGFGEFIRGYESFSSTAIAGKGDIKQSIEALVTETERVKKFGFTAAELERAKVSTLNNYERSLKEKGKTNSSQVLGEYLRNFLSKEPIPGIDAEYAFVKQILPEIKLDDVNKLTKDLDAGQKKFVLVTGPEKRDVPVPSNESLLALVDNTSKLDVKAYEEKKVASSLIDKIPSAGKIISETKDEDLGTVKLVLSNGVSVVLKSTNFKNDEIVLNSYRFGGSSLYPADDKFSAAFSAPIVTEMGVKDLTPVDLQKYLSGKTVRVSPMIAETSEGFSGTSSVKDFETMLQLIYLYATQPRKDDALFTSFISKQKTFMSGIFENPNFAFQDTLNKVLSQNHPRALGFPHAEDFDKVNENKAFDIFKERLGNADGLNFYIIGSLDIEKLKPLIAAYLGSLPSQPAVHEFKDLGVRSPKGVVKFNFKKGKEQKSLAVLNFAGETNYDADENTKLQAAIEVLQIKVIEKLREEMGGVYGASVRGGLTKNPYGKYNISFNIPCGPENVNKLIAATLELIENLKKDGPSEVDLAKVKETWKKKYQEDIKTNNYWVSSLMAAETNKVDAKRILNFEKRVDAITIDDVKKAAQKYFDLNNYVTGVLLPE
jgi:zinc protease